MTVSKKATMRDIANLAGVTTQTVSRALSGSDKVNPKTKRKVIEIANSLNYIKNSNASILRSGSSKIIAVFYDNLKNIYFSLMSDFLSRSFRKYGYTIMTIPLFNNILNLDMYKYALSLNVAGILTFIETDDELSDYLKDNWFPLIVYGRKSVAEHIDYIAVDDVEGGRIAARELLEGNGKSYLYVGESLSLTISKDRYEGFREEVSKSGFKINLIDVSKQNINEELDKLARANMLPDAIFCFNDMLACSTLRYYEKNKLPKPDIVGFDALSDDISLPVELKSIGVDKEKIANLATEILISKIERKSDEDISITMPVKLYK